MPRLHQNVSNLPRSLIPKRHERGAFSSVTPYTLRGDVLDRDLSVGEVYDLKNRQNYPSNKTAIKR